MATMKDVAREAGVSLGTVSNVLNGLNTVSDKNKEKVFEAIEKLKYHPNMMAKALKTSKTKSIGLLLPDITNPYYPRLARGVEDEAKRLGYTVFLCNSDRNESKEKEYLYALMNKNVDGLIWVKPLLSLEILKEIGCEFKIVLIENMGGKECEYGVVNVDIYNGVKAGMELLFQYGHRDIAFIGGLLNSQNGEDRYQAYVQSMKENGLTVKPEYIKMGNYGQHSGYANALEVLKLPKVPTAIFAANDLMAIGAIKAMSESGLSVPRDISILGFDDIEAATWSVPALTTIKQPNYEVGAYSMGELDVLLRRGGESHVYNNKLFQTTIIMRDSIKQI